MMEVRSNLSTMKGPIFFYIFCLSCLVGSVFSDENVPVLIWNSNSLSEAVKPEPLLSHLTTTQFNDDVIEKLNEPIVLFFLQDTLSTEDFSTHKEYDGEEMFASVKQFVSQGEALFLPSVQDPAKLIDKLSGRGYQFHQLKAGEDPSQMMLSDDNVLIVVNLQDVEEGSQRVKDLQRNDAEIGRVYQYFQSQYPSVVGILSAYQPAWISGDNIVKRSARSLLAVTATTTNATNCTFYNGGTNLLYSASYPVVQINGQSYTLNGEFTVNNDTRDVAPQASLSVRYLNPNSDISSIQLRLSYYVTSLGNWKFHPDTSIRVRWANSTLQDASLRPTSEVSVPLGFSYHCTQSLTFVRNQTNSTDDFRPRLSFSKVQFQPFNVTGGKFSAPWDCVGFFSIGILSGLFVTVILAAILMWALLMIADVKTMDRFDDPKGKPLVITATD